MATDPRDEIRHRINIAELIGESVALKPEGNGRYKGLCPFHEEKTPSFHVHADKGFYYCFGCRASGDIFSFVMNTRNVSFPEALQLLGERAGVEVSRTPQPGQRKRRDLYDLNQLALEFFRQQLTPDTAAYLHQRGLKEETIDEFEIGFAPDSWDQFLSHATTKGASPEDLLRVGLVGRADSGRTYDAYRNRIMFPIRDQLGRLVGFSGRVLDDSVPKYINSPESDIFKKGTILYGLDRARKTIREEGTVIITEGYTDVMALHQVGFTNAVAALGATITDDQAAQLQRLEVHTVVFAFDADEAGQKATLSGLDHAVGRNFFVRAAVLPGGRDPADIVLQDGKTAFEAVLAGARSEVAFRFDRARERFDRDTPTGQRGLLTELLPVLVPRTPFDQVAGEMRRLVLDYLGLTERQLDDWIDAQHAARRSPAPAPVGARQTARPNRLRSIEVQIAAMLLGAEAGAETLTDFVLAQLPHEYEQSFLREFAEVLETEGSQLGAVLAAFAGRPEGDELSALIMQGSSQFVAEHELQMQLLKALSRLRELHLTEQRGHNRRELLNRLRALESEKASASDETLQKINEELREIQRALAARDAERRLRVSSGNS